MTPERYQRINQLFHQALELPLERREAFVREACGADQSMRIEVEEMLRAHLSAGNFLSEPAVVPDSIIEMPTALVQGRQIQQFQILSELGRGGMGEVYLAEDRRLERRVALKLLPMQFTSDRERVRRFEQEAKAASALNHPNIVTIHEIGTAPAPTGTVYYIAAEYIEGKTLRDRIKQGRMPVEESLEIAGQVASALQVAHDAGITHRDIKPENIMLRPDGIVKVLDFGLAKLTEPEGAAEVGETPTIAKTIPGTVIGTPAYMSPEQARGLEIDGRSDLWSLGIVLYELLTGIRPFHGQTTTDIIVSIVERPAAQLSSSHPHIPSELDRIVTKALEKDKERRYQTAGDMASDLKKLKRQMELDAELSRISQEGGKPLSPGQSAAPLPELETQLQVVQETHARTALGRATTDAPPSRRPWIVRAGVLLLLTALGMGTWIMTRPKNQPAVTPPPAAPVREISYALLIQRMHDGKPYREPFVSLGRQLVEDGWKFRMTFSSPQDGYLYLVNEGPIAEGALSYQFLFPIPSLHGGQSQLRAGETLQTGSYLIGKYQGTERLLIVWSTKPVDELEALKGIANKDDIGIVRDPAQLSSVREFFMRQLQRVPEESATQNKMTLRLQGDPLVCAVDLEHR